MVSADPERVIETIGRRTDLLRALQAAPSSKRGLVAELPISRSTVDRAVRDLEASGLATRDSGTVSLTFVGRLALSAYEEFYEGLDGLQRASGILDPIPADVSMDIAVFRGADIVHSEPHAPHQPVQALKNFLRGADRIRGVASAVLPDYVSVYSEQIIDEGTEVELVLSDQVLETVVGEYGDTLEASLGTGRLGIYSVESTPPFSTIIAYRDQPELAIVVYGESGTTGLIRNSASEAVDWGEVWIEEWIDRGTDITGPGQIPT